MKQLTLATVGFERYAKTTRRTAFLAEMERVVPWPALCALIDPVYPKPGNGRPPVGVERMLRIYFLQRWFNLSDPAVGLAEREGVSPSYFTRLVRLSYLAPDITHAILDGRQPRDLTAEKLLEHSRLPLAWHDQRTALGFA